MSIGAGASRDRIPVMLFAIGVQLYRLQRRRAGAGGLLEGRAYAVFMGCILGAAIGNKLVFWLEFPQLLARAVSNGALWMSGSSIVGGLLGGLLGVELAKKLTGQPRSTGDLFVLPLMAGIAIGRIGCSRGPERWHLRLADHAALGRGLWRWHRAPPDPALRPAVRAGLGRALLANRHRWREREGLLFKLFLAGYLLWRAAIDAIKPLHYTIMARDSAAYRWSAYWRS